LVTRSHDFADRKVAYRSTIHVANGNKGFITHPYNQHMKQQKKVGMKNLRMYGEGLAELETISLSVIQDYFDHLDNLKGKPSCFNDDIFIVVANVITSMVFGKRFGFNDVEMLTFADNVHKVLSLPNCPSGVMYDILPCLSKIFPNANIKALHQAARDMHAFMRKNLAPIEANFDKESISCFSEAMYKEHTICQPGKRKPDHHGCIFCRICDHFVCTVIPRDHPHEPPRCRKEVSPRDR